ncbi:MAG: hypothetical protein ACR2O6_10635 [Ilumatobacteraceae bacterium]
MRCGGRRPDHENWDEARALAKASEITLRSQLDDPAGDVPIGLRDRLANTLADRPPEHRGRIVEVVEDYQRDLDGGGFSDAELHAKLDAGGFLRSLVSQVILGVLLFPFALLGAAINLIPYLIVKAAGLVRVAPAVAATVKPIVAFLAFGATWGVVIWRSVSAFGWQAGVVAFLLLPIYLAAVIAFVDRLVLLWRAFRRWSAGVRGEGLENVIAAHRAAVVEAVLEA